MAFSDNNPSGRPLNLRLLIGAVIAIIAFLSYHFSTQVNPTTGEKQHVAMSPGQEMQLGLQSAPQMAAEMGGEVNASDPRAQLVQRVGMKVLANSSAKNSPYFANFHFHLLADTKTINAFALPGGQVFITRGLLDRLQTEAQLAGVLGHETGHVIERHSAQQMAKSKLGQELIVATGVAASGDRDHPGAAYSAAAIAGVVNQMKQLSFSREDETQADTRGLQYMSEAGYDPRAMLGVMKILQDVTAQTGRQPEMLQTHPYPEHRMTTIQSWLQAHYPNGVPANLTEGAPLHVRGKDERGGGKDEG